MDQIENDLHNYAGKEASKEDYPMKLLLSMAEDVREDIRTNIKITKFLLHKRKIREPYWLNSSEALALLKVSKRTLERYRKLGAIRFFVIKGHCRYLNADVLALLAKQAK